MKPTIIQNFNAPVEYVAGRDVLSALPRDCIRSLSTYDLEAECREMQRRLVRERVHFLRQWPVPTSVLLLASVAAILAYGVASSSLFSGSTGVGLVVAAWILLVPTLLSTWRLHTHPSIRRGLYVTKHLKRRLNLIDRELALRHAGLRPENGSE